MCVGRFAGRVRQHPPCGSLENVFEEAPHLVCDCGGVLSILDNFGDDLVIAHGQDVVDEGIGEPVEGIGSWRPIGAVVAAVVAGLGHGVTRPPWPRGRTERCSPPETGSDTAPSEC